jgi:uncharacterized protein YaeQ
MATASTVHRFEISVSDSDRGVYQELDLRAARHPSETLRYLLTRTIALCLFWEEDIAFSKGLSTNDEPAVWVREPDGRVKLWLDVGLPSAERLHKASKAAARVVVCTHHDLQSVLRVAEGERIHRAASIEVAQIPSEVLDPLEKATGRHARWELVHTGGQLYVTVADPGGKERKESAVGLTFEGPVTRQLLVPS